ncbi:MAG: AMP-dependent synthetase [Gammaproteobacteria bacterium]|nr:AMP-dependent synthetase [Gammaproteobacteria bacterium]
MPTIHDILAAGDDNAVAVSALEREDLTYAGLRTHINNTVLRLNQLGIGRGDRVAIVLPNGPEMATAFVAVAGGSTTAPLNPAYTRDEFAFYLEDLNAKAVVVEKDSDSPAVDAARELGIPILSLVTRPEYPAGQFELDKPANYVAEPPTLTGASESNDIGLILHTSGTTSRPKIVPLTQANLAATARNVATTLALEPSDRCLQVMPLFHIHGLMAGVLAPLRSGSSIFCSPGFDALRFFGWLESVKPTWYTAVPTMHQAILARAARNQEIVSNSQLRLIRSSSSSLPPQVFEELEKTFGAPVIEAYGMTEAAHQMTCNQIPPGQRKPGTVGPAAGPEVSIMSESTSTMLAQGDTGEVVIRGENVCRGYENNPEANAGAFEDGWFRTGDQGYMDTDGFLTITGRLKEIINRGGEKISPREVDDILMDHPAIAQVVTFAMPHKILGEEVAAAAVLREGESTSEKNIKDFASERLAPFKVPRKILFLEEIPKGATGKLQRIGLAEKLGLTD